MTLSLKVRNSDSSERKTTHCDITLTYKVGKKKQTREFEVFLENSQGKKLKLSKGSWKHLATELEGNFKQLIPVIQPEKFEKIEALDFSLQKKDHSHRITDLTYQNKGERGSHHFKDDVLKRTKKIFEGSFKSKTLHKELVHPNTKTGKSSKKKRDSEDDETVKKVTKKRGSRRSKKGKEKVSSTEEESEGPVEREQKKKIKEPLSEEATQTSEGEASDKDKKQPGVLEKKLNSTQKKLKTQKEAIEEKIEKREESILKSKKDFKSKKGSALTKQNEKWLKTQKRLMQNDRATLEELEKILEEVNHFKTALSTIQNQLNQAYKQEKKLAKAKGKPGAKKLLTTLRKEIEKQENKVKYIVGKIKKLEKQSIY